MPDDNQQPRELSVPLELERAAADAELMQIPVSFASGAIIDDMMLGPVRLSMDPSAIDLGAATERGIPVHAMHARGIPVGRVTDVRLDGDRLRGIMRFSRTDRGRDLYRDASDGIITDTSVGATISAVSEQPDHLLAIRWRPREVSLVDEGADQSVGINRAARPTQLEDTAMPAENEQHQAPAEVTRSAAQPTQAADSKPRDEINIRELGDYAHKRAPELGIDRMRDDYIAFGKPFEEFSAKVWRMVEERQAKQPAIGEAPAELGLTRNETQQFSIVRAAQAQLTGNWKKAGFELECSRAVADRLGREARGFFVPMEVQRTMSVGDDTSGGYLVGTQHRADLFIEALRARSVAMGAGVRVLDGLTGNLSIPKLTGSASFYWLSEGQDGTTSDLSVGSVNMSPRTVAGAVPMTRRLLMQSAPSVEQLVRQDLMVGAALAIDLAVFEGDGVNEPLGIVYHSDINNVTVATDTAPTFEEIVAFETAIDSDNALSGALRYITTPAIRGKLKTTKIDAGSGIFVMGTGNEANGYPVSVSTQLSTSRLLFGDWSQIIVGFWGVLDVKADESTNAASGGLVLRVFQDADVAVRHGQSFAVGT